MSELDDMDDMSCDEFAEVAAELALGVLTGRERAAALAHLDGCESCREHVRELTMVGMNCSPCCRPRNRRPASSPGCSTASASPPPASRHRMGRPGPADVPSQPSVGRPGAHRRAREAPCGPAAPASGRPPGSLSRRLLAAAAVAVALVGGGVGWGLRDATAPASASSQTSALSTASFVTSDHQVVGQAFVYNRVRGGPTCR